jgi:hypothetical protein
LQCESGAFAAHALSSEPPQLLVHQRHEFFKRRLIPTSPLKQKLSDISCHEETRTLRFGSELRLVKQDKTLRRAPQFITSLDLIQ